MWVLMGMILNNDMILNYFYFVLRMSVSIGKPNAWILKDQFTQKWKFQAYSTCMLMESWVKLYRWQNISGAAQLQ